MMFLVLRMLSVLLVAVAMAFFQGSFMTTADRFLFACKLFSALGCGLMAGVFFAFSTFVMRALARLQPAQGIAAMQSINLTVLNPWFFAVFFGTAATCLFLAAFSLARWSQSGAGYLLAGSLLYLLGTIVVTIVFNEPMNQALARVEPGSADGANLWAGYLADWTVWNHVRTMTALAAAALFSCALCHRAAQNIL